MKDSRSPSALRPRPSLRALLLFHLSAGGRVARRAAIPVFAALAVAAVFQDSPAAFVIGLADAAFADPPRVGNFAPLLALALALPAWAAARLSGGVSGWLRHLPFDGIDNRRGLALALVASQLPLAVILVCLAIVASADGLAIGLPAARWALILPAAAIVSLPARRRAAVVALGATALLFALYGSWRDLAVSGILLLASDVVAGRLSPPIGRVPWAAGSLLHWRIAWRALGMRLLRAYGAGGMALAAGWLAIVNNRLAGSAADSVARFSGAIAVVLTVAALSKALAQRRPMWPLARSLPWSARQRVVQDACFLAGHALPLVMLVAVQSARAALQVAALLPLVSMLGAGHMRLTPERPSPPLRPLWEGTMAAALLTLLPWTAFGWLPVAIAALWFAEESDRRQKITSWSDLDHDHAADAAARSAG